MITPPLPPEVLAQFPGLEAFGHTATRLHPRPAAVTAFDSHVGGPLLWPADEPWPTCDTYSVIEPVAEPATQVAGLADPGFTVWGTRADGQVIGHRSVPTPHTPPNPMTAVAQLRAADIPDLPLPGGTDLLQVLWCPFEHDLGGLQPAVRLVWRREADVTTVLAEPPGGQVGNEEYLPRPCRLHPEQIVEYPDWNELPDDLRERAEQWDDGYTVMFMAPGWKVGGFAGWPTLDVLSTPCPRCAGPTTLLMVIASWEYDNFSRPRWRPIEERHIDTAHPDWHDVEEPTGITLHPPCLRIFVCARCPGMPFRVNLR